MLGTLPVDPQAPYVCLGCSKVYAVCPDFDAYDCPACGEKVCPVRLWTLRCEQGPCDGGITFLRTEGGCLCPGCGLEHRQHPFCKNSEIPEALRSSSFPEYILHVLCDGLHVKL